MKICIYSLSPKTGGGVIIKTLLLIGHLLQKGHHVTWIHPKTKGKLPSYVKEILENKNVEIIEKRVIPYFRVFDSFDFFSEIKNEFDIYQVISGYCIDGLAFRRFPNKYFIWSASTLNSEKFGISFFKIKSFKNLISYVNYKIGINLEKSYARKAHKIFAASRSTKMKIINELSVDSKKTEIINPIIDTKKYSFKPSSSRKFVDPYVLYMGIFSSRKNIDLLIKSFEIVHKENPLIKLKLVGNVNGFENYFENLIKSLKLENCIEIVGEVIDNVIWYQNALCTALTSYEEGFGMVLAESLSCGTPVVATDSGGVTDIVQDGKNGFLVGFNEKEISNAILKVCEDKDLRNIMSLNGREHIENSFSINSIGHKILNEYEEFLEQANAD